MGLPLFLLTVALVGPIIILDTRGPHLQREKTMKVKLAEALLRRKELQGKVDNIKGIKEQDLFKIRVKRVPAAEGIDDVTAAVPMLKLSQVTHEFDWHARQLRLVDAAIQQANWTTEIDVESTTMGDYVAPVDPAKK